MTYHFMFGILPWSVAGGRNKSRFCRCFSGFCGPRTSLPLSPRRGSSLPSLLVCACHIAQIDDVLFLFGGLKQRISFGICVEVRISTLVEHADEEFSHCIYCLATVRAVQYKEVKLF